MGLRDIESTLPPGFKFYPSDEELVCHYLYKKVANVKVSEGTMVEVDLHTREPWELPEGAKLSDDEWYFFSFRDRKYATGSRANRATKSGYWKATGKDRTVYHPKTRGIVGMRKTLVFYSGRAPNGVKTGWVMHEFRLENPHTPPKEDWVLCRVFNKRKGEVASSSGVENLASSPPLLFDTMGSSCMNNVPHQEGNSNTLVNLEVLHYNFHEFIQELETTDLMSTEMGMGSKDGGDDDYGFLFDAGLDDDDHAMGVECGGHLGF
ncbi:uncharacterized protein A4U43_C01F8090 [Asparagus officinalis]|uniref:NAC domain-containing protein n=1 Tax=Asparagus officinalis TaxID=4686 RepID=A0A5P1FQB6_ASPOF|nr:protein CUP-SHAPED COTYLEDON 3-like [Asparagus officinalis]XP_020277102.1 protein CUP-SHAPED COTYLEDON 3-like [Asparagus officinalis]XP_020277109.1 protein CUP-SHAPED COTYLEDON 3-like [Asparagus officinalis]XP_020277114.1 protein CUP-SHAPED COTYLEDON 3-like [Asparagus officinalis]XP_020277124.1 protein CUP-SHAPED COTYLEDON 3-like [Asparagus officinalis]XP_020277132.1 protein CUP-SHAPED COTYLEDON 3-like [Asparagus officinalis]XP_020277140.1 protein CUP-SHAPED COTYLEDON 3-like [Asparagus off